jgi:heme-degrading monooxygenase HmoA
MFNEQQGFMDVFFGEGPDDHLTITLWEDERSIEALERSCSYRATVAAIHATGLLRGNQSVEVFRLRT